MIQIYIIIIIISISTSSKDDFDKFYQEQAKAGLSDHHGRFLYKKKAGEGRE